MFTRLIRHRQIWLFNHRVHHGAVGLLLILFGAYLVWDDRADVRRWLI